MPDNVRDMKYNIHSLKTAEWFYGNKGSANIIPPKINNHKMLTTLCSQSENKHLLQNLSANE